MPTEEHSKKTKFRKQKKGEKQLYGYFKQQIVVIALNRMWTWLSGRRVK